MRMRRPSPNTGPTCGAPAHSALCYTALPSYTDLMRRLRDVASCGASIDTESSRVPAAAVQAVPAGSPVPDRPRTRRDESFLRASPLASSSSLHLGRICKEERPSAPRRQQPRLAPIDPADWSVRSVDRAPGFIAPHAKAAPRARHAAVCQQQKGTADAV